MNNFVPIVQEKRFIVYIDMLDADVVKNIGVIYKNESYIKKLVFTLRAIRDKSANRTMYNFEGDCNNGNKVYAIKFTKSNLSMRFYTLDYTNEGVRQLFISKYGKKQSEKNTKKLTALIEQTCLVDINSKTKSLEK